MYIAMQCTWTWKGAPIDGEGTSPFKDWGNISQGLLTCPSDYIAVLKRQ